jgi:hypothetical protein
MQQPRGTSTKTAPKTFEKVSAAAGVTIKVALPRDSPSIAKATEIASTVPPSGIAIFPPKLILKRALF